MCLDTLTSKRYKSRKDLSGYKGGYWGTRGYRPPVYGDKKYPFDEIVSADEKPIFTNDICHVYTSGFHVAQSNKYAATWGRVFKITIPQGTMIQRGIQEGDDGTKHHVIVASQIIIHPPEE